MDVAPSQCTPLGFTTVPDVPSLPPTEAARLGQWQQANQQEIYGLYNEFRDWNTDPQFACLLKTENVRVVSEKVTQLLQGVHPEGKKIVVPDSTIRDVLSANYQRVPLFDPVKSIDEAVSIIVSQIRSEFLNISVNDKLSAWTTVLGDYNEHELRGHSQLKIKPSSRQLNKFFVCGN